MSGFDRIERRLPEVMAELAPATVPDYFDDLLGQTRRTRQRPAWASLERWLPMDAVARSATFRAPVWRPVLILLLIGLLIGGGLALYAGSQRTRVPEPFGPARNGLIVVGTAQGDIAAYDPVSGTTTPLIAGPAKDLAPWFSRDGSQFIFVRETTPETGAYWVANADGTNAHEIVPAPVEWLEWSDDGRRVATTRQDGGRADMSILDLETGESTVLAPGVAIEHPYWRPGHDQIVFRRLPDGAQDLYWIINANGNGAHPIEGLASNAVNDPQLSPDGSKLTYASWGTTADTEGQIHVLDIDAGTDRIIDFEGSADAVELDPQYSPDGSKLVFERYADEPTYIAADGEPGFRIVIAAADGSGPATPLGPPHRVSSGGANVEFSPDGTQLLVTYADDGSTWLLDVDGGEARELPWSGAPGVSWQRLAP